MGVVFKIIGKVVWKNRKGNYSWEAMGFISNSWGFGMESLCEGYPS